MLGFHLNLTAGYAYKFITVFLQHYSGVSHDQQGISYFREVLRQTQKSDIDHRRRQNYFP